MKKYSLIGLVFVLLFVLGLFVLPIYLLSPVSMVSTPVEFTVKQDESASEILNSLANQDLVRSRLFSKIYLKLTGQVSDLRPGVYSLSKDQGLAAIISTLVKGPKDIRITIPEGWRREQIAQYLSPYLSDKDFMINSSSLEGRLFPDTYYISSPSSSLKIIKFMTDNFNNNFKNGVNNEALIIASMVERESRVGEERGIIAGILWKRYKNNWALQIDATLQYAQGRPSDWWPKNINTKLPSAYNTYTHTGLPPGPIGNPGLDSIKAALEPVESPYWFYLHDNSGVIHYASTIEGHNLNVDKYLNR